MRWPPRRKTTFPSIPCRATWPCDHNLANEAEENCQAPSCCSTPRLGCISFVILAPSGASSSEAAAWRQAGPPQGPGEPRGAQPHRSPRFAFTGVTLSRTRPQALQSDGPARHCGFGQEALGMLAAAGAGGTWGVREGPSQVQGWQGPGHRLGRVRARSWSWWQVHVGCDEGADSASTQHLPQQPLGRGTPPPCRVGLAWSPRRSASCPQGVLARPGWPGSAGPLRFVTGSSLAWPPSVPFFFPGPCEQRV